MNPASYATAISMLNIVMLVIQLIAAIVVGVAARRTNVWVLLGGFFLTMVMSRGLAPLLSVVGYEPRALSMEMFVVYAVVPQVLALLSVFCLLGAVYVAAAGDRTPRVQYPTTGYPGQYPSAPNPFPERGTR